ncbi:SIR2 family protein [Tomitella gaofuii]|uniref:SIR2 family protein n=1 Tax=Tomitella gaofuii TaxID=2760083 RepID=UPI0015F9ECA7|nr:SIR2 family protein [Tomitella gaofuii]
MNRKSIVWPRILIDSLTRGECVIFVGAGFTKNAVSPKPGLVPVSWSELLSALLDEVAPQDSHGTREPAGKAIESQIGSGDLLWAAQALEYLFQEAGRSADFREVIAAAVDGTGSTRFQPGRPHQALLSLDARIIVTTNYDKVLERLFSDGYTYLTYKSDNIAESIRTGRSIVLKLHGSTDDPKGMVLTRLDFSILRRNGEQALKVLEALTLTRTVLFLGYGLDDPDLHLIMENQMRAAGSAPGHYLLTSDLEISKAKRNVLEQAFGVHVIRYQSGPSEGFVTAVEDLAVQVESSRMETHS